MNPYLLMIDYVALPLAPEKMKQNYRSSTKTTMTVENGEVIVSNKKGLMEFTFTLLIPQYNMGMNNSLVSGETLRNAVESIPKIGHYLDKATHSAQWYLLWLEDLKNSSRVFKFTVIQSFLNSGRILSDQVRDCVIDSMVIHYGETAGNMIQVDLTLAEYTPLFLKSTTNSFLPIRRAPTTWYDSDNVTPLLTSGVNFLKRVAQNGSITSSSGLPPLLSTGLKAVGWKLLKTSISTACPILGMLL